MSMRLFSCTLVFLCLSCKTRGEQVCNELIEVMEQYYEKYDSLAYTHVEKLDLGCPETPLSKNPFFPGLAVVMYLFLKEPGECVLSSCSAEAVAVESKRQDCGTRADWELPWFPEPKEGLGQLDWERLICDAGDGSYFKEHLPDEPACNPSKLSSVASVKECLVAAEMSGKLEYCSRAQANPALHQYNVPAMYITWHRELASTGVPPQNAVVMGFSFGKGASCQDLMSCTEPGKTNGLLATAAIKHQTAHPDAKLALQFEIAVASKMILEAKRAVTLKWVSYLHDESVKQLEGYEIYALGGFNNKYLNTAGVYDIGAGLSDMKGLILLAHPSHMPRVYRTVSAHGAVMSEVFLSLSPLPLDWTTAGAEYNMFAETSAHNAQGSDLKATSVWEQMKQEPTRGMYLDSDQKWTRQDLIFSLSEFWVYPLQMLPGKHLVGSLPDDPVKLPICKEPNNAALASIIVVCSVGLLSVAVMIVLRSYRKVQPDALLHAESDEYGRSEAFIDPQKCAPPWKENLSSATADIELAEVCQEQQQSTESFQSAK